MLKLIRWRCTLKCNYKCPMCGITDYKNKEKELNVDEYYNAIVRQKPVVLDITGGEPLMRKGVIDLIGRISYETNVKLAITTNISVNLDKFVMKVNPAGFHSFVCSFHPEYTSERHFLNKLVMLRMRGFNPRINFVAYPTDLAGTGYYKDYFEQHGFNVHVDRYVAPANRDYTFNKEEEKILDRYLSSTRKQAYENSLKKSSDVVYCDAGKSIINALPDLDVFPCLLYEIKGIKKMGNLKDDNFSLLDNEIHCGYYNECLNCDLDHTNVRKTG